MGGNAPGPGVPAGSGLAPNVAAGLSYLLGFITGIIFLVIEKRDPIVRYAAWQSILLSVAYILISIVLGVFFGILIASGLYILVYYLSLLIRLAFLALWLWVMIRAFQGQPVSLPVIGAMAERYSRSV
ncbi:MAG: hypothetical protein M0031_12305 [Thermaerobacter sp.]|jgi:uncharacterized membrane protein|nr:hypothetical protein [Thermaerobacter sp.]